MDGNSAKLLKRNFGDIDLDLLIFGFGEKPDEFDASIIIYRFIVSITLIKNNYY
jgi:hypothetical protein